MVFPKMTDQNIMKPTFWKSIFKELPGTNELEGGALKDTCSIPNVLSKKRE